MSSNSSSYTSPSLYVGDLHPDVTEAYLYELFRDIGPIVSIRVCRDAITRKSLGYAYVNFQNPNDAERAIDTLNFTGVKGRPIRIMWIQKDPSIRKSGIGNIFIKNLDKSIDNKALYDTFSTFGNILSCKVEQGVNSEGKIESLGYGFVHFETQEAAEQAIAKVNGMLINGKVVYVGPFIRKQERLKALSNENKFTNVYINNLPKDLKVFDDKKLKEIFGKYGEITSAVVQKDKDGQSKGFGFVNFKDPESAKKAVAELNGKDLLGDGKQVYVGRAQKKAERKALLKQQMQNKYQGVNLYVKNLDDSFDDNKLKETFSKFGTITSAKVMKDEKTNTSRGFGFVCFSKPEEATKAITEMNGRMVGQKPLYVALAQRKEVRRAQLEAQHAQRQGMKSMVQQPMFQPMIYPQPGIQQPGFMYHPQMVRPPRWTGQQPPRHVYPMPTQQFMQPQQPQQQQQQGGKQKGKKQKQKQGQQQMGVKFNQNARNRPDQQPVQQPIPQQIQQPMPQERGDALLANLATLPLKQQKQFLGEKLFPLVHLAQPQLASKITGMLLEMDNGDILHLLESEEALHSKINEAVTALKAHEQKLKEQQQQQQQAESKQTSQENSSGKEESKEVETQ